MTAMVEERPVFENAEWLVTDTGLEHKATGYFIERESLASRRDDGLWMWPMQMAEKSWCALPLFAEAFSRAASVYNVETGADLAQSFRLRGARSRLGRRAQNAQHPRADGAPTLASAGCESHLMGAGAH